MSSRRASKKSSGQYVRRTTSGGSDGDGGYSSATFDKKIVVYKIPSDRQQHGDASFFETTFQDILRDRKLRNFDLNMLTNDEQSETILFFSRGNDVAFKLPGQSGMICKDFLALFYGIVDRSQPAGQSLPAETPAEFKAIEKLLTEVDSCISGHLPFHARAYEAIIEVYLVSLDVRKDKIKKALFEFRTAAESFHCMQLQHVEPYVLIEGEINTVLNNTKALASWFDNILGEDDNRSLKSLDMETETAAHSAEQFVQIMETLLDPLQRKCSIIIRALDDNLKELNDLKTSLKTKAGYLVYLCSSSFIFQYIVID